MTSYQYSSLIVYLRMQSSFSSHQATAAPAPLIRAPGVRPRLHVLLNRPSSSRAGRALRAATLLVILISALLFVLESLRVWRHGVAGFFWMR